MNIYALADFHLSFGVPGKSMEIFGDVWKDWTSKIEASCHSTIKDNDLLLIAGDISWASSLEAALVDLEWIAKLPGIKVLLKGNHDHWWPSSSKLSKVIPNSIHFIHNNALNFEDVTIGGSRLWDSPDFNFDEIIEVKENPLEKPKKLSLDEKLAEDKRVFERELTRLQMSLDNLSPSAKYRIAMTHYPPIGLSLNESIVSKLLESYKIDMCVFGHLHSLNTTKKLFGKTNTISYHLTSCDYLDFKPLKIL